MVNWDKPIQLRNGCEVCIYTRNGMNKEYPVVGEFKNARGGIYNSSWSTSGVSLGYTSQFDIINKPPEKTFKYRRVYNDGCIGTVILKKYETQCEYTLGYLIYEYENNVLVNVRFEPLIKGVDDEVRN